jgi:hypothetical protein
MFKNNLRRSFKHHASLGKSVSSSPSVGAGRCVALVDARFMGWLLQPSHAKGASDVRPSPADAHRFLEAAMAHAGLDDVELLRVYWYTGDTLVAPVNHLIQRVVQNPDLDGGLSLSRALQADLGKLVDARAVEHLLLVSDDERLVHGVVDEAGVDTLQLAQEDPSWARLLMQADRRVVLRGTESQIWKTVEASADAADDTQSDAQMEKAIAAELAAWWAEEPETQRLDLQSELQYSRV